MSLRLYKMRSDARMNPKCSDVDTFLLKTDTPIVSIYFHGRRNPGTSRNVCLSTPYQRKKTIVRGNFFAASSSCATISVSFVAWISCFTSSR